MSTWFEDELSTVDEALQTRPGLQALDAADRERLGVAEPRRLDGSCCIDDDLAAHRSNEPRWDYAVGYAGRVWFIEVHPADSSGNVDEVVRKATWLRGLLGSSPLLRLPPNGQLRGLYWVASGRVTAQLAFSRSLRRLAEAGVGRPTERLHLRE